MKISIFRILSVISAVIAILGCAKQPAPNPYGDVSGCVTDFETGKAIPGATVSLGTIATANTDSDGCYAFQNIDPGQYKLNVSAVGYEPGTKTVTIKANFSSQGDITLRPSAGAIALSINSLDFGTNISSANVTVENKGNKSVTVSVASNSSWLSASPVSLTIPTGGSNVVTVVVDRNQFKTANDYDATLEFTFDGGTLSVPVRCKATEDQVNGSLTATPNELIFSKDEVTKLFTIRNTGKIPVTYDIGVVTEGANWISSISPSNGTLGLEESQRVAVSVDRSEVKVSGVVEALLAITYADNSKQAQVSVKMDAGEVSKPTVQCDEVELVSYNAVKVKGQIKAVGSHPITSYGICYSQDPSPDITSTGTKVIDLGETMTTESIERTISDLENNKTYYFSLFAQSKVGLAYSNILNIKMPDNVGDVEGYVTNIITKNPVSSAEIAIGNQKAYSDESGYYKISAVPSGSNVITISADGYVTAVDRVDVGYLRLTKANFELEPALPSVRISTQELNFGADRDRLSFDIENTGSTKINYDITTACGWVSSIKPATGSIGVNGSASVIVSVDRSSFSEKGTFNSSLKVSSEAGETTIQMSITVGVLTAPSVTITRISNVTWDSAEVSGAITSTGSNVITEYGICYSETNQVPTISDICVKKVGNFNETFEFSFNAENLTAGKDYYVRTYARSEAGTAYSPDVKVFTTDTTADGSAGGSGSGEDFNDNEW